MIELFALLARYNTGANRRLYDACAALSDAERKRDAGAFFGSIHGTLNHILVGDRIWLARFAGETVPSTGLDAIPYQDFDALWQARQAEDHHLAGFVAGLTGARLTETVRYRNNEGRSHADPLGLLVAHLFNHQTHHRGQVTDLLSRAGAPTPVLDLHRVLRPDPVT